MVGSQTPPICYKVKQMEFFYRKVPIVMQNENGPCPLLALANVLLLRNQVHLPLNTPEVAQVCLFAPQERRCCPTYQGSSKLFARQRTAMGRANMDSDCNRKIILEAVFLLQDKLISLVAGYLLDSNNEERMAKMEASEEYRANVQQNIADAIALLPKLATGVDVNVRFDHIRAFEFTHDVAIFDLLDIRLVHGWLIDPQVYTSGAACKCSFQKFISIHFASSAPPWASLGILSVVPKLAQISIAKHVPRAPIGSHQDSEDIGYTDQMSMLLQDVVTRKAIDGQSYNEVVATLVNTLGDETPTHLRTSHSRNASFTSARSASLQATQPPVQLPVGTPPPQANSTSPLQAHSTLPTTGPSTAHAPPVITKGTSLHAARHGWVDARDIL